MRLVDELGLCQKIRISDLISSLSESCLITRYTQLLSATPALDFFVLVMFHV